MQRIPTSHGSIIRPNRPKTGLQQEHELLLFVLYVQILLLPRLSFLQPSTLSPVYILSSIGIFSLKKIMCQIITTGDEIAVTALSFEVRAKLLIFLGQILRKATSFYTFGCGVYNFELQNSSRNFHGFGAPGGGPRTL